MDNEVVVVEMSRFKWESIKEYLQLTPDVDYKLKEVVVKDDLFKDNEAHAQLKKASIKAYKALKEFEFNHRHNIKS